MDFTITARNADTKARCGTLLLSHGPVQTPAFMPVGTNATVKAVRTEDLSTLGVRMILSNTYHLYLRPGIDVIERVGGLHRFMAWDRNILTDSGGYQVFSLAPFRSIDPEGVTFRSHVDGSSHRLTPERVMAIQGVLGSDIVMPLDVCTPPDISREEALKAVEMTTRWAERSKSAWDRTAPKAVLFGIVQGNFYRDLRERSARELQNVDFPGYAIGGLSVGEAKPVFLSFLSHTSRHLPDDKPRYLMGIGTPDYILEAVDRGIDLFDCVYPTRTARNALVFTRDGPVSLKKKENRYDEGPIDPECSCRTCRRYSRAYLRHLYKSREILAPMLTTFHNLAFIQDLIGQIRFSIREGTFKDFMDHFLSRYLS